MLVVEEYQQKSSALLDLVMTRPDRFHVVPHGDSNLICYHQNGENKIVLTQELLPKVVNYYHEAIARVEGMTRLGQTIKRHFYHSKIDAEVKKHVEECKICPLVKHGGNVYGESAPRDALVMP